MLYYMTVTAIELEIVS